MFFAIRAPLFVAKVINLQGLCGLLREWCTIFYSQDPVRVLLFGGIFGIGSGVF